MVGLCCSCWWDTKIFPLPLPQNLCCSVGCDSWNIWTSWLFSILFPSIFSALWFLYDRENGGLISCEFCGEGKQIIIIPTDTTSSFSIHDAFSTVTIELVSLIYLVYHAFCNWLTIILSTIVPIALIVYTVTENIMRTE